MEMNCKHANQLIGCCGLDCEACNARIATVTNDSALREKTAALLDLPAEGVAGTPKVSLTGDRELYLENYKGILAYGKEEIHVNGGPWVLRILGRDLEIKAMRAGEMRITGWVERLELL